MQIARVSLQNLLKGHRICRVWGDMGLVQCLSSTAHVLKQTLGLACSYVRDPALVLSQVRLQYDELQFCIHKQSCTDVIAENCPKHATSVVLILVASFCNHSVNAATQQILMHIPHASSVILTTQRLMSLTDGCHLVWCVVKNAITSCSEEKSQVFNIRWRPKKISFACLGGILSRDCSRTGCFATALDPGLLALSFSEFWQTWHWGHTAMFPGRFATALASQGKFAASKPVWNIL